MIKFYNFLSRKKGKFIPIRKEWVGLYTCGPTVYDFVQIGNLRTFIFEDLLRRTLEYAGYKAKHVMNITDVEDKIIKKAQEKNKKISQITRYYEKAFFEDIKALNIKKASFYPRATEHIKEMVSIIGKLLKNKLAYKADGSVYFDISRFKPYGKKLAKINIKNLKAGARVDVDEYGKEAAGDFVLWKGEKLGEPSWAAPFGRGRPGWHIECSAMSSKYLGQPFDIHTGGVDLIFPHHEDEIAQSEGAFKKPFAKYFLEGEHLLVNGRKMSKSLGNFYTLCEIEEKNINPIAFRYLVLTTHYRSKLNFTWESLDAAKNSLDRLYDFIRNLGSASDNQPEKKLETVKKYRKQFEKAIFDDLDAPKAIATIWNLINQYNKKPESFDPGIVLKMFYDFDEVLGLGFKNIKKIEIPKIVSELTEKREQYRSEKKWKEADKIRDKIKKLGFTLEDSENGPKTKSLETTVLKA